MCVVAAATGLACAVDSEPPNSEITSEATFCYERAAGDPWWIATFSEKTKFHVTFQVTPHANNIDAVIGVSKGVASTWSQLAAIVRFAPSGVIDVRNGSTYSAATSYPYFANWTFYVRMDIDVTTHTYSVYVKTDPMGSYTTLASNYAFRTEQANVTSLDAAAAYVDTTAPGSLELCDLETVADDSTPDGCVTSNAGAGFANAWFEPIQYAAVTQFWATPSADGMDGVVGYSGGEADGFGDLAASVRFFTNGMIEARDGTAYRATNQVPYAAGHTYHFYVVLDLAAKTYSVMVSDGYDTSSYVVLADSFHFRPEAQAPLFNNLATVVDSAGGQVRACNYYTTSDPYLQHIRTGNVVMAPFRDGRTARTDGTQLSVVDNAGQTLVSAPGSAQQMTVDANGNIYLASVDGPGTTLTLTSVTQTLAPRWTHTYAVSGGLHTLGVYDTGEIALAAGGPALGVAEIVNLHADGSEASRIDLRSYQAQAAGIGRDRFAIGYVRDGAVVVEMRGMDGALLWQRSWPGTAQVYRIAVEPSGSVVFGGSFGGTGIDFGAGHYEPYYGEVALNGYIVALTDAGELRFANRLYADGPSSLASSGDRIAYATTRWSQIQHPQLWVYDRAGTQTHGDYVSLVADQGGSMGQTIVDSEGRVIANVQLKLHPSNQVPLWPVLASFVY